MEPNSFWVDHKRPLKESSITKKWNSNLENVINNDGEKMSILSHLRSIGDRTYRVNLKIFNEGVFQDETIQKNMVVEDEVALLNTDLENTTYVMHPYDFNR